MANFAFGQGTLMATPLQLASLYACIANDGGYQKAMLIEGLVDDEGNLLEEAEIQPPLQAMSVSTAHTIQRFFDSNGRRGERETCKARGRHSGGQNSNRADRLV